MLGTPEGGGKKRTAERPPSLKGTQQGTQAASAKGVGLCHCLPPRPGPSKSEDQKTPTAWLSRSPLGTVVRREVGLWLSSLLNPSALRIIQFPPTLPNLPQDLL